VAVVTKDGIGGGSRRGWYMVNEEQGSEGRKKI